jgi:hypothetical protein
MECPVCVAFTNARRLLARIAKDRWCLDQIARGRAAIAQNAITTFATNARRSECKAAARAERLDRSWTTLKRPS